MIKKSDYTMVRLSWRDCDAIIYIYTLTNVFVTTKLAALPEAIAVL